MSTTEEGEQWPSHLLPPPARIIAESREILQVLGRRRNFQCRCAPRPNMIISVIVDVERFLSDFRQHRCNPGGVVTSDADENSFTLFDWHGGPRLFPADSA